MPKPKWFPLIPLFFPLVIPLLWPGVLILLVHIRDHHPVHGVVYEREMEPAHPIGMTYAGDRFYLGVKLDQGGTEEVLVDHEEYVRHPEGSRYDRSWTDEK